MSARGDGEGRHVDLVVLQALDVPVRVFSYKECVPKVIFPALESSYRICMRLASF